MRPYGFSMFEKYNYCCWCGEYRHKTYFKIDKNGYKRDPECGHKLRVTAH